MTPANDNATSTTFAVGKTYRCRSICDYDCIFSFTVTARTDKTVTITVHGKPVRRKVRLSDGVEAIDPHGRYSMSPVLRATDLAKVG
jgi:hypothetical protein